MILLTRVDHRLLHGQVAVSWVNGLKANCVFVVGDHVANDPVWKTTLRLGKPAGCKLVVKDMARAIESLKSGVTDKYRMIICVGSIAAAKQLAEGYQKIRSINLGNTKESPTTRTLTKQVFVEPDEEQMLRDMAADGIELEYRALADDPKVDVAKLLDE